MMVFLNNSNGQIIKLNLSTNTNGIYIANVHIWNVLLSIPKSETEEIDKYYIRNRDKVDRHGKRVFSQVFS